MQDVVAGDWCQDPLRGCTHRCTNPLWCSQGAEAQPGEKPRSRSSRTRGFPHTPPKQGEHLFKDEVLVIGAVIGASWDVPGDPYKGLRGAGGLLQPVTWRGGEGVVWLLDGGIGASWGEMQGSSRACTLTCRGEVGFWPGKGLEAAVSGWGEGLNLPAQPWPHQLCLPGPRDPLPDG